MTIGKLDTRPHLIIDWSVISYKCWSRMNSDNYEPEIGDEIAEFTMNAYGYLLFLKERLDPYKIYFALDSRPNWRDHFYQDYYIKNAEILQLYIDDKAREEYIVKYDVKTVKYWYHPESRKWMMKKMLKADIEKTEWKTYKDVNKAIHAEYLESTREKGLSDYEQRKGREECTYEARKNILYGTLKEHFPAYKGTRKNTKWTNETPKHGYTDENGDYVNGYYDYSEALAKSLAGTFGGRIVKADLAEADDIIAYYVKRNKSARDLVLVSVDSDLHQLYLDNLTFKYYNPNKDVLGYSPWGDFVELTTEQVTYDLRSKLICGDTSDNIPGCMYTDDKGNIKKTLATQKTADKLLAEDGIAKVSKVMEPNTLARNRKLVHLDNVPKHVNGNIAKAFRESVIPEPVDHKEYLLPVIKSLEIKQAASDRKKGLHIMLEAETPDA